MSMSNMRDCKISCKNLPKIFFEDKNIAKNHFRRFGRIKRMIFKPKIRGCSIEYVTSDSVEKAIEFGCIYEDYIFKIDREASPIKKVRIKKNDDPDWVPDPDVLEELHAMGGGPSVGLKKYNLRPESMDVELAEEKPKKTLKRLWPAQEVLKSPKKTKPVKITPGTLNDEQLELLDVIKKAAYNIDDKFKILEARDKLLRSLNKKNSSNKTGATQGTCPDMCPEKERLQRVIQHQISVYEQDSTKEVNPALVVKQYSRSSADQEASLPHELRPVSVLQMTMSYLIHKIMNLGDNPEVNVGDWYYFLWDRTRSIRKDVTQQELCSQGSVALVEQCARFHIHCSARLVAEEPSVFDQKINSENLTKCLQTLKYMYNDLRIKGVVCPDEAEFRAYIILLNLNDGNFMWEVQKLKPEIQKSHLVKTAIEIYSALDKNNFIKFFKLVNNATYLNACILMRYFMQVRIRAVTTLLKCYSPRISTTVYPVEKLTTNLAFESNSHTIEFLQSCGLTINASQTGVILDRNMFTTPDFTYTCLDRSVNVVESKRKHLSVGEVVCGGSLPSPDFENYVPQNSFSEKGFLKFDQHSEIQKLLELNRKSKKVSEKPEKLSKPSMQPIISSTKVRNPYVFIKESKEDELATKPFRYDRSNLADYKKSIFEPVKSSIFSLDYKKKNENISTPFAFQEQENKQLYKDESDTFQSSNENSRELSLPQNDSRNIFAKISQNTQDLFKNAVSESLFKDRKDNQPLNIFSKNPEKSTSHSIFSQVNKIDNKPEPIKSIFGNTSSVITKNTDFFSKSNVALPIQQATDVTDFKEIKWDIAPPQEIIETENTITDIFFNPPTINIPPAQNVVPNPVSLTFAFTPHKEEIKEIEIQKQAEIDLEILKEKERKLQEEKIRLEQEEKERLRQLEIERKIAENKRKDEEERIRCIRQQEYAREIERRRLEEIQDVISKLMPEILDKVETQVRDEKLDELRKKIYNRMLINTFRIWKNSAIKLRKQRKALACSPLWACTRSPKEEAAELQTESQNLTLKYMKRYKLGVPLTLEYDQAEITKKISFKELSHAIMTRYCELGMKFFKEIYWKGVISLPDISEMPEGKGRIDEILRQFFGWTDYNGETVLFEKYFFNQVQSAKFCIEKQDGLDVKQYDANGFIFLAKNYNQVFCKRIFENVKEFGIFVKIPIVIIFQERPSCPMHFDTLVKQGIISNYLILVDTFNPQRLIANIETGLEFLLRHTESIPPLQLDTMKAFLNKYLCSEIWKKAKSFCKWNSVYKQCLKNPNIVIELYNETLRRLKDIILNKSSYEFANFPTIFRDLLPTGIPDCLPCDYKYFPTFCKEQSYFDFMSSILNTLKLKPLPTWPPACRRELGEILSKYIIQEYKDPEKPFYKVMASILRYTEEESDFLDIANVIWTDIIEILAQEKINQIDFSFANTEFFGKSIFNQVVVIYNPDVLEEYSNSDWFYVNNPIIHNHIEDYSYLPRYEKCDEYRVTNEEIDEAIANAKSKIRDVNFAEIRDEMEDFNNLMTDLEESLSINKKISAKLQERLVTIVEDG